MQKITPCLWFDSQAEGAVNDYLTLFNHAKITRITHYDKASAEVSAQNLYLFSSLTVAQI